MRTIVSTIIYRGGNDLSPHQRVMIDEAKRVAELGGTFSIRQYYSSNWFEEYTINYPDAAKPQPDQPAQEVNK